MKEPDSSRVIVTEGVTAGNMQLHHQDFPEIRAHGESLADAAGQLANQLTRALDSALTEWRRETIQQAVADVDAYQKAQSNP